MINSYSIIAPFPCHGMSVRLVKMKDVPRQIYTRRCPDCKNKWEIEVTAVEIKNTGPLCGAMINTLSWGINAD